MQYFRSKKGQYNLQKGERNVKAKDHIRMHRLATVHARDNQPTNDQRRHDTAYLNKRLFY